MHADQTVAFVCNLCGAPNRVASQLLARETPSCASCASTVRFRSIAHLVVRELLGSELPLNDVRRAETIRGIGLSDAPAYAVPLAKRFDYTNTFFHARPRLDITDIPDSLSHRYRFVISSDVFEHVAPPVSRAFEGARKLLADDGFLVLTVPFSLDADTVEHFPELHDFRIEGRGAAAVLQNRTRDGRTQRFHDLVFHGGQGATLEMRLFARASLERELLAAGFSNVRFCDESYLPFGIVWRHPWSIPIVARP